jgi:hypothetical protein
LFLLDATSRSQLWSKVHRQKGGTTQQASSQEGCQAKE